MVDKSNGTTVLHTETGYRIAYDSAHERVYCEALDSHAGRLYMTPEIVKKILTVMKRRRYTESVSPLKINDTGAWDESADHNTFREGAGRRIAGLILLGIGCIMIILSLRRIRRAFPFGPAVTTG